MKEALSFQNHSMYSAVASSIIRWVIFLTLTPFYYCQYGFTTLIYASSNGHTAVVELLLKAGADKDAKYEVR
jgi:ankyrin repeat protein